VDPEGLKVPGATLVQGIMNLADLAVETEEGEEQAEAGKSIFNE
jgi:hypothetical protein